MSGPSIKIDDVAVVINGSEVLSGVNLEYEGNGIIQILGPNGAGKTTLLRTIIGTIRPIKGKIYINKEDVTGDPHRAGKYVGFVPQHPGNINSDFPISVWEILESEYSFREREWPRIGSSRIVVDAIESAVERVGLELGVLDKNFWELSGGEKQRILIARALIHEPRILLLDEPFSPIDPPGRIMLADLIVEISRNSLVITTSHDPMLLLDKTDRILLLNKKISIFGAPNDVLTVDNTKKVYGESIISVGEGHIHIPDIACKKTSA